MPRIRSKKPDVYFVDRVVAVFGSPKELQLSLGASYDSYKKWRQQGIPLRYHLAIEELSGGKITVEMLAESRGLRLPGTPHPT